MMPEAVGVRKGDARPDPLWRQHLSNFYGLFVISMLMFEAREVDAILRLARIVRAPSRTGGDLG
jgi:hypothetical protein